MQRLQNSPLDIAVQRNRKGVARVRRLRSDRKGGTADTISAPAEPWLEAVSWRLHTHIGCHEDTTRARIVSVVFGPLIAAGVPLTLNGALNKSAKRIGVMTVAAATANGEESVSTRFERGREGNGGLHRR